MNMLLRGVAGLSPVLVEIVGFVYLANQPPPEARLVGFATRLEGRTHAQRHNADLAARSLNGAIIPKQGLFSFNKSVKTWSVDRGYVRAPVSYDGGLVPAFGGGVCQTSSTLYNAALLAGMEIRERHHHVFAPHYVPPGRDAAVAYPNIDLVFRNPYSFPVRVVARTEGDTLLVELWGRKTPGKEFVLQSRILSSSPPERVIRHVSSASGRPSVARYTGIGGCRVVTYRLTNCEGQEVKRERLSDDSYPSMPNIVSFAEPD